MELHPECYRHRGREATIRCQRCARPVCTDCMTEASVGFQCPDCVASGRRDTRQAEGPYGGVRASNPALTSQVLIAINALVWIAVLATGGIWNWLGRALSLTPQGTCGVADDPLRYFVTSKAECLSATGTVWHEGVSSGAFWQVLTSAFTHVEFWHIGFNMLALWFLGPTLEAVLGRVRFIAAYLASAVTGSLLVMWFSSPVSPTIGASGAIFGLMGAILVIAWKHHGDVKGILTWLGLNAVITFLYANISWQGHLGGFLGGAAVAALFAFAPKRRRSLVQWGGLAALMAVCFAFIAVRAVQLAA